MNEESTNSTLDTPSARATGPVRCTSWCEEGRGHLERYADDQYCYSVLTKITGSLLTPWEVSDGFMPAYVHVLARAMPGAAAHVTYINEDDRETRLTPEEARELAGLLTHFAWVAEQDGRERDAFQIGVDAGRAGIV